MTGARIWTAAAAAAVTPHSSNAHARALTNRISNFTVLASHGSEP